MTRRDVIDVCTHLVLINRGEHDYYGGSIGAHVSPTVVPIKLPPATTRIFVPFPDEAVRGDRAGGRVHQRQDLLLRLCHRATPASEVRLLQSALQRHSVRDDAHATFAGAYAGALALLLLLGGDAP